MSDKPFWVLRLCSTVFSKFHLLKKYSPILHPLKQSTLTIISSKIHHLYPTIQYFIPTILTTIYFFFFYLFSKTKSPKYLILYIATRSLPILPPSRPPRLCLLPIHGAAPSPHPTAPPPPL